VRLHHQLIGAALLAGVTYAAVLRVAEAKNEAIVGGRVFLLDDHHPDEKEAYARLRADLDRLGQVELSRRLDALRAADELWVAASLGPERWAVYVDSLGLVRRVYVRQRALVDPRGHLYPQPRPDIPDDHQRAFALLSLAGALQHELTHRDGVSDEGAAYDGEIAWLEDVRRSSFISSLAGEERRPWDWGLESALLSARKARENATGRAGVSDGSGGAAVPFQP
jgi:hypothetical protein